MGIKDLLSGIKKAHPQVIHTDVKLITFKGCKLTVDIPIYAWKYMAIARKDAIKYIDPTVQDPDPAMIESFWLEKYFLLGMTFIECGITPIMVFDGPAFRLKQDTQDDRKGTTEERREKIRHMRKQLLEEPDGVTADKMKENIASELEYLITFTSENWEKLERMLRTMGVPVLVGPYEAEAVCARLVRYGYASGVVTNDGDALPHGATIMIRDVKRLMRGKNPQHKCECIILKDVLNVMELSMSEFIDFCMLLGTDYNTRVKRHGFITGFKNFKKHKTMEKTLKNAKDDDHTLHDVKIREEIKGYFTNDFPDAIPDHPLIVFYENGLTSCFEDIFSNFYRIRMVEKASGYIETLLNFNQNFASMQNFILIEEKFVNINLKKIGGGEES